MTKRRARGDGGLHWDDNRQRWIATASQGYDPAANASSSGGAVGPRPRRRTNSKQFSATTTMG